MDGASRVGGGIIVFRSYGHACVTELIGRDASSASGRLFNSLLEESGSQIVRCWLYTLFINVVCAER